MRPSRSRSRPRPPLLPRPGAPWPPLAYPNRWCATRSPLATTRVIDRTGVRSGRGDFDTRQRRLRAMNVTIRGTTYTSVEQMREAEDRLVERARSEGISDDENRRARE